MIIFKFQEYFGHFLGFGGILVIFWVLGMFWSFLGFRGILVIFRVLGYFGHFLGFEHDGTQNQYVGCSGFGGLPMVVKDLQNE